MCRHTARSHPEATNSYEDGLFELLVVASIISSPPLYPPSHHTEILGGADVLPAFYSFSSLQLLSSKFPGLGRPVPRLCLQVFLLELIHQQALRPGQGPAPGRSGLFLIKPVCKYHLQSYSQQKSPVYCILASGFLRSLDLEKREQVCLLNEVCHVENRASQNHFLLFCTCIHFSLFTYSHFSFFYRLERQTVQHFSVKWGKFHLPENPKLPEARDAVSSRG